MQYDLKAASAGKYLALYDRSSQSRELAIPEADHDSSEQLWSATREGKVLLVHFPEECEGSIRVFVDEEPPSTLIEAAHPSRLTGASLLLPSGVLVASGAEDIGASHENLDPTTYSTTIVPAGSYRASAFSTIHWKIRNRSWYVSRTTSTLARLLLQLGDALGIGGALFLVGNLFALPGLSMATLQFRWPWAWKALVAVLVLDTLFVATIAFFNRVISQTSLYRQAQQARETFDEKFPDIVIVLTSSNAAVSGQGEALLTVPA